MIKPTIGRVVWFHPLATLANPSFCPPDVGQPCAAIVARVWSDECVNLAVFDANGVQHPMTSVPLVQEGEAVPQRGYYCEWMPFQIGQQKAQAGVGGFTSAPPSLPPQI